jgi:ectoine hydroxylase-related dioxygenase (phytanoyl-CoA dioxygenase family)
MRMSAALLLSVEVKQLVCQKARPATLLLLASGLLPPKATGKIWLRSSHHSQQQQQQQQQATQQQWHRACGLPG